MIFKAIKSNSMPYASDYTEKQKVCFQLFKQSLTTKNFSTIIILLKEGNLKHNLFALN